MLHPAAVKPPASQVLNNGIPVLLIDDLRSANGRGLRLPEQTTVIIYKESNGWFQLSSIVAQNSEI